MTNDEFLMTSEFPMSNDQAQRGVGGAASTPVEKDVCKPAKTRAIWNRRHLSFQLCHSLGIRHSSFVIASFAMVA